MDAVENLLQAQTSTATPNRVEDPQQILLTPVVIFGQSTDSMSEDDELVVETPLLDF